jgi:hypothetical protein
MLSRRQQLHADHLHARRVCSRGILCVALHQWCAVVLRWLRRADHANADNARAADNDDDRRFNNIDSDNIINAVDVDNDSDSNDDGNDDGNRYDDIDCRDACAANNGGSRLCVA